MALRDTETALRDAEIRLREPETPSLGAKRSIKPAKKLSQAAENRSRFAKARFTRYLCPKLHKGGRCGKLDPFVLGSPDSNTYCLYSSV